MTTGHRRRGPLALLVAAVAALTPLVPTAAYAESAAFGDPARDPIRFNIYTDVQREVRLARNIDITRTVFDYRQKEFVVRAFVKRVSTSRQISAGIEFYTDEAYLGQYGDSTTGPYFFRSDDTLCRGVDRRVNTRANAYVMTIPARCLGGVEQVRATTYLTRPASPSSTAYDEALQKGYPPGFREQTPLLTRG